MKLSQAISLLVLSAAVCLSSANSRDRQRQKRIFFGGVVNVVKEDADVIGKDVNSAVGTIKKFVNTQVKDAKGTLKTVGDDISTVTTKAGNILKEGIDFVLHEPTKDVTDQLSVNVQLVKTNDGKFSQLKVAPPPERDNIIDDIFHDAVHFAATVENDVKKAVQYTVKEATNIEVGVVHFAKAAYKASYDKAHEAFDDVKEASGKIAFQKAVVLVVHFLSSSVTDALCDVACQASADTLLGIEVEPLAFEVCPPVCSAAMSLLEDMAEQLAEKAIDKAHE